MGPALLSACPQPGSPAQRKVLALAPGLAEEGGGAPQPPPCPPPPPAAAAAAALGP